MSEGTDYVFYGPGYSISGETFPGLMAVIIHGLSGGDVVTADFSWYYRVKFEQPKQEFEMFHWLLWKLQQMRMVVRQPADLVNTFFFRATGGVPPREPFATPEREKEYPEPSMFGMMPAYGFFLRHVTGVELHNVEVGFLKEDRRPPFVLDTVKAVDFQHVKARKASGVPAFVLLHVEDFSVHGSPLTPDAHMDKVERKEM